MPLASRLKRSSMGNPSILALILSVRLFVYFLIIYNSYSCLVGQNGNNPRSVGGVDPKAQGNSLPLPFDFVVSRGGAYFFVPSISALETKFAA